MIWTATTEEQIEAGAKALFGDGWEKNATAGNRRYCRQKVMDMLAAIERSKPANRNQSE